VLFGKNLNLLALVFLCSYYFALTSVVSSTSNTCSNEKYFGQAPLKFYTLPKTLQGDAVKPSSKKSIITIKKKEKDIAEPAVKEAVKPEVENQSFLEELQSILKENEMKKQAKKEENKGKKRKRFQSKAEEYDQTRREFQELKRRDPEERKYDFDYGFEDDLDDDFEDVNTPTGQDEDDTSDPDFETIDSINEDLWEEIPEEPIKVNDFDDDEDDSDINAEGVEYEEDAKLDSEINDLKDLPDDDDDIDAEVEDELDANKSLFHTQADGTRLISDLYDDITYEIVKAEKLEKSYKAWGLRKEDFRKDDEDLYMDLGEDNVFNKNDELQNVAFKKQSNVNDLDIMGDLAEDLDENWEEAVDGEGVIEGSI